MAMMQKEKDLIYGQERRGQWIPLIMGLLFIMVPSPGYQELLPAWHRGAYILVLVLLLFPLVGVGMLLVAFSSWRHYRYSGPSPLRLDPSPGASGGQVGGEILLNH